MKQTAFKSKSARGKEEKKNKVKKSRTQERGQEYADFQARKQPGGDVASTQNNRIRHQGRQGNQKKSGEGDTRNKQKTTKRKEKTKRNGKTENDKKGKGKEGKRKTARRVSRAALC